MLSERFGPFTFGLALVLDAGKLRLIVRRWSVLGLPLPVFLAPGGDACEFAEDGRFRFHVEIMHPIIGLIVRYRGWLVPGESGNGTTARRIAAVGDEGQRQVSGLSRDPA